MLSELRVDRIPTAPAASTPEPSRDVVLQRPLHLLCYVHLRNIYRSTGAGRVARQMVEGLANESGIHLRILADRRDREHFVPLAGEPWSSFGYCTFTSDTSRQQARWFLTNHPPAESYWPEADIIYCTGESYVPRRKARLVVTAHDAAYFEDDAHHRSFASWTQRQKWALLFQRLTVHADMIHTVSHFSAERLAHFFPALAARIRVVPNAVTACFFAPPTPAALEQLDRQELLARPYILIPGGLHFRKNADLVLTLLPRIMERFPDLRIIIAGHCSGDYAARAASFGPNLCLTGFVEDEILHALYASACVVWFPSRYEGFGLPVVEAMASGAPVVASNAASIPEIAGDAALLAKPDNPWDHLDALVALVEQPALREHLIRLGRSRARHFIWQRSAAQLKQCFHQLL